MKFCVDCKYFSLRKHIHGFADIEICLRHEVRVDYVTGNVQEITCYEARSGRCGYDAIYWEKNNEKEKA
jgi:hypothetical protein